jgi:hypothetical protein
MTVWQHDPKFRLRFLREDELDEELSTILLHPNYAEKKPEIVVVLSKDEDKVDKLKLLQDNIVGFKLYNVNSCKDLLRAGYQTLKKLTIVGIMLEPISQDLFQLTKNSCSTLVSLKLCRVDLSIFTNLLENFSTLYNLEVSRCVNNEGLAALLKYGRVSLKSLKLDQFHDLKDMAEQLEPFNRLSELEISNGNRDVFDDD